MRGNEIVMNKFKVVIWGCGECYNRSYNIIKYFELTKQLEVTGIVDNNVPICVLDGYKVMTPKNINQFEYDYIIVMSDYSFKPIVEEAVNKYGIIRRKLISYKVLQIPMIKLDRYFELYESKLSIVSNNCVGGVAYNTLSMECLSPFKNLFVKEKDYIKMISNLKWYIDKKPIFDHYEEELKRGIKYPVLKIDTIEIHCNHTTSAQDAIDMWERRKKKINYDNLFFVMYTMNGDIADAFLKCTENYKSVCFVPWEPRDQREIKLIMIPNKEFYDTVNVNASLHTYSLKYSIVDLFCNHFVFRS